MTDIVDVATRSRMMAGIQGKNTKPEMFIRKALHARGFRFRLHVKTLPGKPDLVFPKYNALIFVHGCFWHGHSCRYFKCPQTRPEFWLGKIEANRRRDEIQQTSLLNQGWRVLVVWECAVRSLKKTDPPFLIESIVDWLVGDSRYFEVDEQSSLLYSCFKC